MEDQASTGLSSLRAPHTSHQARLREDSRQVSPDRAGLSGTRGAWEEDQSCSWRYVGNLHCVQAGGIATLSPTCWRVRHLRRHQGLPRKPQTARHYKEACLLVTLGDTEGGDTAGEDAAGGDDADGDMAGEDTTNGARASVTHATPFHFVLPAPCLPAWPGTQAKCFLPSLPATPGLPKRRPCCFQSPTPAQVVEGWDHLCANSLPEPSSSGSEHGKDQMTL